MGTSTKGQTWPHNNPAELFTRVLNEIDGRTSDVERCPQYSEDNGSRVEPSAQSEFRRSRGFLSLHSVLVYTVGNRVANHGESLSRAAALRPQAAAAAAPGHLFEAEDSNDTTLGRPEDGVQWTDLGSPNAQAATKCRTKGATPGGTLSLMERNEGSSASGTPSNSCLLHRDNPNRGWRKEMGSFSELNVDATAAGPPERGLPHTYAVKPTIWSSCYDHERQRVISIPSLPPRAHPRPSLCRHSPFHALGMRTIKRITELTSILLGYVLTFTVINSHHPDNGWLIDLPLMQLLPPSFTHPSSFVMLLQFMGWSLIGIFHLLQSPRYWPECGLIANAVSIAVGGWFGLRAMLDSLIITAFISLLVAKAIEWVSESRLTSRGGLLPLSEQDRKH